MLRDIRYYTYQYSILFIVFKYFTCNYVLKMSMSFYFMSLSFNSWTILNITITLMWQMQLRQMYNWKSKSGTNCVAALVHLDAVCIGFSQVSLAPDTVATSVAYCVAYKIGSIV